MARRITFIIGHCAPGLVYPTYSLSTSARFPASNKTKQSRTPFNHTTTAPPTTIDSVQALLHAQYTRIMDEINKKTTHLTKQWNNQHDQKFAKVLIEVQNKDKVAAEHMKLMREIAELKQTNEQLKVRRQTLSLALGYLTLK